MFNVIGKGLKVGLRQGTGRKVLVMVGQWVTGATLMGLGFGIFSRGRDTLDDLSGRVSRPQLRVDARFPPPPAEGGPAHMHADVSVKREGGES